ncbi:MAG: GIDE domain-containing protein [Burkholderiales bacterium]
MFRSAMHGPWWLTGTAHLVILIVAVRSETPAAWPWALLAMAGVSFFAWLGNFRRYRQIHDLPTSKIVSAAQGYVELLGRGDLLDGTPVISKLGGRPCCWYRYKVEERRSDNKWQTIDEGTSVAHFLLVDDSGACVVSPEGAEVVTSDHRTWYQDPYRHTEWLLPPKDVLYALGEFTTHGRQTGNAAEERAEVSALIANWKEDMAGLHKRFDLDQDGTIDLKEWELARLQAVREVRKQQAEQAHKLIEGVHLLRKPRDGRLFLLANEMPDRLGRRYWWWSLIHLIVVIGGGIGSLILFGIK